MELVAPWTTAGAKTGRVLRAEGDDAAGVYVLSLLSDDRHTCWLLLPRPTVGASRNATIRRSVRPSVCLSDCTMPLAQQRCILVEAVTGVSSEAFAR